MLNRRGLLSPYKDIVPKDSKKPDFFNAANFPIDPFRSAKKD